MIQLLQHDFIPVAANTAYLAPEDKKQRNWCPTSKFIEGVIEKSRLRKQDSSETAQGYYTFSAVGDFYGGLNGGKDEVLAMLLKAQKKFSEKPPEKIEIIETSMPSEAKIPDGAAVVNVFSRIDPLPPGLREDDLNRSIGRDHLWILKDELKQIASGLQQGNEMPLPRALALRLVRFHLIDNVRGEPDLWDAKHIKVCDFKAMKVEGTEKKLKVRVQGSYSMLMPPRRRDEKPHNVPEMGLVGMLEGVLEIDTEKFALRNAKMFAEAEGWGESVYTKTAPKGKFPLKFAFVLNTNPLQSQIAPQGVMDQSRDDYIAPK